MIAPITSRGIAQKVIGVAIQEIVRDIIEEVRPVHHVKKVSKKAVKKVRPVHKIKKVAGLSKSKKLGEAAGEKAA